MGWLCWTPGPYLTGRPVAVKQKPGTAPLAVATPGGHNGQVATITSREGGAPRVSAGPGRAGAAMNYGSGLGLIERLASAKE